MESTFASAPTVRFAQGNVDFEITVRSEPTKNYGVGLVGLRDNCTVWVGEPCDQHLFWLQHSPPVPVSTRLAGKLIERSSGPRKFNSYPAECDSILWPGGPAEGVSLRVSAECVAFAASQLGAHGGSLVAQIGGRDETLYRIGLALEAEAAAGHPNGMLFWSCAADALIRHVSGHHLSRPAPAPRGGLGREALKRLDAYIDENLGEPLDLDCLASFIGCDRFHFAHRFRATAGISPHRYVMRRRLERARQQIRTGTGSLSQIAFETGFTDQSHLCRWARRVYNLRPRDLKN